ncbi:MAG: dihydroorotate dehydrogenase electron transfer subunit [Deltaproteobacteria bacterium]|nr:dihydroorotate dehydrogenase electron transfer subunit [Deltaproteobacteria bacterium]
MFSLALRSPGWEGWQPGQFVMVRPTRTARPEIFWGRPFSISRADNRELRIEFQAAGRGTRELAALKPGDMLTVWGPLGNAFAVSKSGPTLLLAGGIGLAPFVGYIARHPAPETLRLEFGHRLHRDRYPFEECLAARISGVAARSHREERPGDFAPFLAAMEEGLRDIAGKNGLALACGPLPFLRSVRRFALQYNARAQLSLETRMACGAGACLGCVVKEAAPDEGGEGFARPPAFRHVRTCANGPVFWADRLAPDLA